MRGRSKGLAVGVVLALAGCAHVAERLPMTSEDVAASPRASALVAYLGQPDADPGACARAGEPRSMAGEIPQTVIRAIVAGKVDPEIGRRCLELLLPRLDPAQAESAASELALAAAAMVGDASVVPEVRGRRVDALARAYLERPPGPGAPDDAARALDSARGASTGGDALRAADALAVGLELERGRWRGRPVDRTALDLMASEVGVVLLLRSARRLPDPALRAEAERLVVRQRIVASPFPEVRAAADAVEATVLRLGTNPVSLVEHPPAQATLRVASLPARSLVVRQRPVEGTAALLGRAWDRAEISVFPAIPLRGALEVRIAGVSRPVTLCATGRALDPAPCLAAADVTLGSPLARVRDSGDLRLRERVTEDVAVGLAREGAVLRVPVSIGNVAAGTLSWSVVFERPPDVVLSGERPGGPGPELTVTVSRLEAGRLLYEIDAAGMPVSAVVAAADAGGFRVVTRGAAGADGAPGMDGTDGLSGTAGMSATCPSSSGTDGSRGGDGTSGWSGGDGARGGRGGDVTVRVLATDHRDETVKLVRASVASEGGAGGRGGPGGRGGKGGSGGRGGMGTSCTDLEGHWTSLGGGMDGMSGSSGADGFDGRPGPSGPPGTVRFLE